MARVTCNASGWTDLGVAADLIIQRETREVIEIARSDTDPGAETSEIGVLLTDEDPHIVFPADADETRHAWARARVGTGVALRVI